MVSEVSVGLVVKDRKLLMFFDDVSETWSVPQRDGTNGELTSVTAEKAVNQLTGCKSSVSKYRGKFKTTMVCEGKEVNWQPYSIEIEGEPENGQWIPLKEIKEKELAEPLTKVSEKIASRL